MWRVLSLHPHRKSKRKAQLGFWGRKRAGAWLLHKNRIRNWHGSRQEQRRKKKKEKKKKKQGTVLAIRHSISSCSLQEARFRHATGCQDKPPRGRDATFVLSRRRDGRSVFRMSAVYVLLIHSNGAVTGNWGSYGFRPSPPPFSLFFLLFSPSFLPTVNGGV
ncbi:hypothetical protein SODALDRAFT_113264 [Sodiomyces alkalinus F11]|uniref:Uncharacterized protein n=1 Tax=Sodiomyces alkalinus (strain CBS 110278 / VKM F-3762 / F11) TaxID=1314773 RepID=A0A3N2Q367_SODAK|nr:hypothetical protein SODALDRAFT_113264 [Sodiomyces alkalinus F11]ROT41166.1 hypothetical protein SODALDRAFT_113264 [Sodiomyces alkalinus F11]